MKKLVMLLAPLMIAVIAGCSQNVSVGIDTLQYSGELVIAGLGPDQSLEPTVAVDTLVLKQSFEDHSDHIFFPRQTWSNYLDIQEDIIPGNHVYFVGTVKSLDAAAGNRYYEVVSINDLIIVGGSN